MKSRPSAVPRNHIPGDGRERRRERRVPHVLADAEAKAAILAGSRQATIRHRNHSRGAEAPETLEFVHSAVPSRVRRSRLARIAVEVAACEQVAFNNLTFLEEGSWISSPQVGRGSDSVPRCKGNDMGKSGKDEE